MELPPEGRGTVRALSRIGYELPAALADIIDNSIDAEARRVEVTFYRDDRAITAVTVADDGRGMDFDTLRRGMQFAGRTDHDPRDLGAYGMGLKSASFSQCKTLSVISRRSGRTIGSRWSVEAIDNDWRCEVLDPAQCSEAFDELSFRGQAPTTGTLVIWERLERLAVGSGATDLDEFLQVALPRLDAHLGVTFHRFLAAGLSISLVVKHERRSLAMPRRVKPLDPFGYVASEVSGYPITLDARLPGVGEVALQCHLWPSGSAADNFLLGSKRGAEFQGFYFYRNDRLVQAGGWNGVVKNDQDPELLLARVAVDLPACSVDVDVQKSSLQVTASQAQAFLRARRGDFTFEDYLEAARLAYRVGKRRAPEEARRIQIPGDGLPWRVRRAAAKRLAADGPVEEVSFVWETLPSDQVFDLDLTRTRIVLNREYRRAILGGAPASAADAPLIKMLLFLLFQDDFGRLRFSGKRREELRTANAMLLHVIRGR